MTNYYAILETEDFASPDDIKKAHRRLSKLYHPDRNNGDKLCEEKFKQVQNAYEQLSDPYLKMLHDERLNAYYATGQDTSNYYYHFTAPQQQEPVHTTRKRKNFYFPWGIIILVSGWIFRSLSNDDSADLNYSDIKVVDQSTLNAIKQDTGLSVLFPGLSAEHDTGNMVSNASTEVAQGTYFTIGSSKSKVAEVQGFPFSTQPGSAMESTWHYGKSYIQFENDIVSGYSNADNNLLVKMVPSASFKEEKKDSAFSIGSTRDEVLSVQGTPVSANANFLLHEETWYYGSSIVTFRNDVVISFINNGSLRIR